MKKKYNLHTDLSIHWEFINTDGTFGKAVISIHEILMIFNIGDFELLLLNYIICEYCEYCLCPCSIIEFMLLK